MIGAGAGVRNVRFWFPRPFRSVCSLLECNSQMYPYDMNGNDPETVTCGSLLKINVLAFAELGKHAQIQVT